MTETNMTQRYECWIDEEERILSFHPEEGYVRKEFFSRSDLQAFMLLRASEGYRLK